MAPLLGLLAAAIGVADTIPYVRDILRGSTRPHRGTWLIWGGLGIVVCFSQAADGASWSLVPAAAQAVLTCVVFALAVRRGEGGVTVQEWALISLAGAGVAGWLVAGEPVVATACVVAADLIGVLLMLPKVRRDPGSETLVTFALASVSGVLAAGAVGAPDVSLLLYPVYLCMANALLALAIARYSSRLATSVA